MGRSKKLLPMVVLSASVGLVVAPVAYADECDPWANTAVDDLDRIVDFEDPFAPMDDVRPVSALTPEEQHRLLQLRVELEKTNALIRALQNAGRGEVSSTLEDEFTRSRVIRELLHEAREESERLSEQTPGNTAVEVGKYFISPNLVEIPDEYSMAIGVLDLIGGQAGAPPVTLEGAAIEILTTKTLGSGIPGALNPYGLAIFTGTQTWDGAKKIAAAMRAAALSDLYQYTATVVLEGKTDSVNGTGLETLLKEPAGRAFLRTATGSTPPEPVQRGWGIFDYMLEDHFDEEEIQGWLEDNALQIYTYINMYREAGGHYPLAFVLNFVDRGFLDDAYHPDHWRQNVTPHHERSRRQLRTQIEQLERKARNGS